MCPTDCVHIVIHHVMTCRLAEDLVPFMDHDIHHPLAHKLATQHKRKQTQHQPATKVSPAHSNPTLCTNHADHSIDHNTAYTHHVDLPSHHVAYAKCSI